MMIIDIDGIPIEVIRKNIKNMNLRIYPPDGLVRISVPIRCNEHSIRQSLQAKKTWIFAQRERIQKRLIPTIKLETGSIVLFQGENYLLLFEEHTGPGQIKLQNKIMYCSTPPNSSLLEKQTLIDNWYKQQMQLLLPNLIKHWEAIIGVHVTEWRIRKMKTRWGSCNTRAARIWLNLNLIKKPPLCLEYVLVHELIHLLEPSHNSKFYYLMNQFMPQWREYEKILKGCLL